MNILVINGSPKGKYSITLQTLEYIKRKFPEHEFRNNGAIDFEDQNDFYWSSLEN